MKIMNFSDITSDLLKESCAVLEKGGILVLPSDTVYGLCVDATNEEAVKNLIKFKKRPPGKAISVFMQSIESAQKYVEMSENQVSMLQSLVPGPFTVVLPSRHNLVNFLESEKGTLGIRVINHTFLSSLLKKFGKPLTATSANVGGTSPHYSIESFLKSLSQKKKAMISLIIDAGTLPRHKPSTVIDLTRTQIKLLRKGDIKIQNTHTFLSQSPQDTDKLARFILEKYLSSLTQKPQVFLFRGELGSGKTRMIASMGKELGITNIVSPTYVGYYEYPVSNNNVRMVYHLDLYNAQSAQDIRDLHIERLLKPNTLLFIEWIEKGENIIELLKEKTDATIISINYTGQNKRKIEVSTLFKL